MDRREFLGRGSCAARPRRRRPRSPGLRVGRRSALVTADLESSVVAVDLSTGTVHRRLRTPPDPRSIESIGVVGALVAHTASGRMTLIDSDLRVRPIAGELGAPRYAAVSPTGGSPTSPTPARREVVVVDVRGRRVVGRVAVGGPCRHLGIDRAGTRLWVALGNKAHEIAVLSLADPRRPRVVGEIRPPFLAHDVGFTAGRPPRLGDVGRPPPDRDLRAQHGELVRTIARRRAAAARHVHGRPRVRHERRRRDAARPRARRPAAALGAGARRLVQRPARADRWILTPSLSQGTLCTFSARGAASNEMRVARSSHDACFIVGT